jgi:hypothetical protein
MLDVYLTYPTSEGSQAIPIEGERISFGRGSEADHRFDDGGLSRLNSIVYRDGDRVWITDENSTNGTFVNGEKVSGAGTPLRDGDSIKIGNETVLKVRIVDRIPERVAAAPITVPPSPAAPVSVSGMNWVPVAIVAFAIGVITLSIAFIGITVWGSSGPVMTENRNSEDSDDIDIKAEKSPAPTPKTERSSETKPANTDSGNSTEPITTTNTSISISAPTGKKYVEMTDAERRQYLEVRAMKVAQVIGNNNSGQIPAAAIDKIKSFADAYASRIKAKARGGCGFGDNLQSTYERASRNAPFIIKALNEKSMDPRIGLYLAMIESEHCVCLQSPTGPLGMFQFTRATAALHGLKVFAGASTTNPDERCEPEPAARAAASYMKALAGRYGTGPSSIPLAIGSYNSGEGGLSSNLEKALSSGEGLPRDFWTLIAKGEILSKQFQSENFKYVPKFFAAAIIGENPQDFGLILQPLSTYSK